MKMQALTLNRIDPGAILAEVTTPESGGIDMFIGTTRNHSAGRQVTLLEYEAYEPMALKIMEQLEHEARSIWPLHKVALVHRLGRVPVLERQVSWSLFPALIARRHLRRADF
jgi:molybdopterin synthase catalytic subunit